jgi:hypothetical protein
MLSGWQQVALLSGTFAAMLATAKIFSKSEAKHERQPKPEIPVAATLPIVPAPYVVVVNDPNGASDRPPKEWANFR